VPGLVAGDVEIGRLGHEPFRERDLGPPHVPRLRDELRVRRCAVEVPVGIRVGGEVRRRVLPGHHAAKPAALHVGQVAHQPQQGQGGRLDRTPGQVGCVQAGALEYQRVALPAQEPDEGRALVGQGWRFAAGVGVGVEEHVDGHIGILGDPVRIHPRVLCADREPPLRCPRP
jgi:hypothetical protein